VAAACCAPPASGVQRRPRLLLCCLHSTAAGSCSVVACAGMQQSGSRQPTLHQAEAEARPSSQVCCGHEVTFSCSCGHCACSAGRCPAFKAAEQALRKEPEQTTMMSVGQQQADRLLARPACSYVNVNRLLIGSRSIGGWHQVWNLPEKMTADIPQLQSSQAGVQWQGWASVHTRVEGKHRH
jgi:hypothetical protein